MPSYIYWLCKWETSMHSTITSTKIFALECKNITLPKIKRYSVLLLSGVLMHLFSGAVHRVSPNVWSAALLLQQAHHKISARLNVLHVFLSCYSSTTSVTMSQWRPFWLEGWEGSSALKRGSKKKERENCLSVRISIYLYIHLLNNVSLSTKVYQLVRERFARSWSLVGLRK